MLAKFITPHYWDVRKPLSDKSPLNQHPELTLGKCYIIFGISSSVSDGINVGYTYFLIKEDHEGPGILYFPAEQFEIVDGRLPPDFSLASSQNGSVTWFSITHDRLGVNSDLFDRTNDREPEAIEELLRIETQIIVQMGYEKYFSNIRA